MPSESEVIEFIIAKILPQAAAQPAQSPDESHFYLLRAARDYGYLEPFSAKLTAMNKIFADQCVGENLARDAWRLIFEHNFVQNVN